MNPNSPLFSGSQCSATSLSVTLTGLPAQKLKGINSLLREWDVDGKNTISAAAVLEVVAACPRASSGKDQKKVIKRLESQIHNARSTNESMGSSSPLRLEEGGVIAFDATLKGEATMDPIALRNLLLRLTEKHTPEEFEAFYDEILVAIHTKEASEGDEGRLKRTIWEMFHVLDRDRDGYIDADDLIPLLQIHSRTDQKILSRFKHYIKNKRFYFSPEKENELYMQHEAMFFDPAEGEIVTLQAQASDILLDEAASPLFAASVRSLATLGSSINGHHSPVISGMQLAQVGTAPSGGVVVRRRNSCAVTPVDEQEEGEDLNGTAGTVSRMGNFITLADFQQLVLALFSTTANDGSPASPASPHTLEANQIERVQSLLEAVKQYRSEQTNKFVTKAHVTTIMNEIMEDVLREEPNDVLAAIARTVERLQRSGKYGSGDQQTASTAARGSSAFYPSGTTSPATSHRTLPSIGGSPQSRTSRGQSGANRASPSDQVQVTFVA